MKHIKIIVLIIVIYYVLTSRCKCSKETFDYVKPMIRDVDINPATYIGTCEDYVKEGHQGIHCPTFPNHDSKY